MRGAWRADAESGGGLNHTSAHISPAQQESAQRPTNAVLLLILIATAARFGFGSALGLGVDESYMVAAGRTLSLGYFDHPPASWWLSWGAAHLLGTEAPIAVRL
ncbi:MAG TPA: hypothetical protein VFE41_30270, partial [Acetobacteraceae bacterium]|nr:hypothetical protein [Acetobacteraceae bacterium]